MVVDGEDDGHTEFVFTRPEGALVVTEFFGKHGEDAIDEVNGCSALIGLIVGLGIRAYVERDVGYMDADLVRTIFQLLEREGVVEIFGISGIDGEGKDVTHVSTA